MKLNTQGITRSIGRKILVTKKNSPHIFFVGGVVGVVGSAVLACRATLKLDENLDDMKQDFEILKELKNNVRDESNPYNEQDRMRDLRHVYIKTAKTFVRLYGPSVAIGSASIAALTGSHIQLTRRNAALSATIAVISKAYDDYRVRVQDEIGKDRELDIHRAVKKEEVEVDGKKKIVKVINSDGFSPYARFFDEGSPYWQKNAEMNRIFLTCQQNYANHRLTVYGNVFLNEVYDQLGIERTQAGQVVGWVNDGEGDRFVDFGMFETTSKDFINGSEPRVILDFNVDGVVYDKI